MIPPIQRAIDNYNASTTSYHKPRVILEGKTVARKLNAIDGNLNQLTILAHISKIDGLG